MKHVLIMIISNLIISIMVISCCNATGNPPSEKLRLHCSQLSRKFAHEDDGNTVTVWDELKSSCFKDIRGKVGHKACGGRKGLPFVAYIWR